MTIFRSLALAGLMCGGLAACTTEVTGEDEADATEKPVVLTPTKDTGLTFTLQMLDGVKASTKTKRFTKLTARRGSKTFELWCHISGQVKSATSTVETVDCSDYAETVSNDDDEALDVTFTRTTVKGTTSYAVTYAYSGDGTIYGKQVGILQGSAKSLPEGAIALKASGGQSPERNPFAMAAHVESAVASWVGTAVQKPGSKAKPVKVSSLTLEIADTLDATVTFRTGSTGSSSFDIAPVSILKTAGTLASGLATKATIADRVKKTLAGPVQTSSIDATVADLEEIFSPYGHHDDYKVTSVVPLDMVKQYIAAKYGEDPELGSEYKFVSNAKSFEMDTQIAGTVSASVAKAEVLGAIDGWMSDWLEDDAKAAALRAKAVKLMDTLIASGAAFGFDGFEQNGCAAPTTFMLVLDPKTHHVYGVDLNPCSES
jgi:hypothetical protein